MASVEITNSGYMVRFLKVTASANISKIAGALTFYTTNNHTYLYLGTDGTSPATAIASDYANMAGGTVSSLTFQSTPNGNTNSDLEFFNGSNPRYISYTTIGAMSDKFRLTAASYANNTTSTTVGGTLTLTLNGVDTTNGTPTTAYNVVSKANTITCDFPKELSINISGTAANATNAANATVASRVANELVATTEDSAPFGYTLLNETTTTYNGSGKRAINYATVGAAKANTAITAISWDTGDASATSGVISGTKSAVITLTRAAGDLTANVPISLPVNITGKSASVDQSITFTHYADAKSAGTSYNGFEHVDIDISRNVVIAPFTISQGHTTVTLTNSDIHADSSIANIIITSGANAMTTAFSFENTTTSNNTTGTIVLTFGAPTAAVAGYAIIVRGTTMASTASSS